MRKRLLFIMCAVISSLLSSAASATVIGSYTLNTWTHMQATQEFDWICNLSISRNTWEFPSATLFNGTDAVYPGGDMSVDISSNIGRTFWISSDQDDPDYSYFVSQLTDGTGEDVRIWILNQGSGFGYPVSLDELAGQPEQYDYPYLQGYTIDRIGLSIDSASYTYDPSATYPHIYNWQLTFIIEGTPPVPEPSSLITLIMGIGGLGVGIRRRSGCLTSRTDKSARLKIDTPSVHPE